MSKLKDDEIRRIELTVHGYTRQPLDVKAFARAIEAAATAPLLQQIAELEKALKLVQQHHATAWNRGHIAGMAANRMVAQDALNAVKKDAWNNTQLTEALMAAEGRCEELERQLEEARKQMEAQKDEWLSWEAKRRELEADAGRWREWEQGRGLTVVVPTPTDDKPDRKVTVIYSPNPYSTYPVALRKAIDAAMKKGQP